MKHLFISLFIIVSLLTCFSNIVSAQNDDKSRQTYRFVYVTSDAATTSVQALNERLKNTYNHALLDGPAIFYLADGDSPHIVKINMEGENKEDFENKFLPLLNSTLNIDGIADRKRIEKMISEFDFLNEDGIMSYKETIFEFYVGPTFWSNRFNELLIGNLYFDLNIKSFIDKPSFFFNVFCPTSMDGIDNKAPFGELNPDGINQKVTPARRL